VHYGLKDKLRTGREFYLTGEYEIWKGYEPDDGLHKIKVRVETKGNPPEGFLKELNGSVHDHYALSVVAVGPSRIADIWLELVKEGGLEISGQTGKPKRIINKESKFWL
jgi:hypothetical protein